ncbi:MAG: hypothetical protein KDC75_14230 [Phaeodactylibacter sp.]|nr:hypothetical protein [Phaeodactylibacter sp.]
MSALVVAGALLSSVFAELASGKPVPLTAAEERVLSLSDGNTSLFPSFDGGDFPVTGAITQTFFTNHCQASVLMQAAQSAKVQAVKQPLFLLFHAFLFYDSL